MGTGYDFFVLWFSAGQHECLINEGNFVRTKLSHKGGELSRFKGDRR